MYQPKKYRKEDPEYIFDFINQHPFATFISQGNRILATHIPVLTQGNPQKFILYLHLANHNEQLQFLIDGTEALLIFQGAHGYVSSSWYREKDISTWDYSAVHLNVRLKLQTRKELEDSLQKLVGHFESPQKDPLFYNDIPEQILKEQLSQITGFWCEPFKIQAIAKLHQGAHKEDIISVTKNLEALEDPMASALSKNIKTEIFEKSIKKE